MIMLPSKRAGGTKFVFPLSNEQPWIAVSRPKCEFSPPGSIGGVSEVQQSMMFIASEDCSDFVVAVDWWGLFRVEQNERWETERGTLTDKEREKE